MRTCALALLVFVACGPAQSPPVATAPPPAEVDEAQPPAPPPPEHVRGDLTPGFYLFPGQHVDLDPGARSLGHLIGLEPIEVLSVLPDDGGYRIALELNGARAEGVVGNGITPLPAYLCLREPATLARDELRADLEPGAVVAVVGMSLDWVEIQAAIGLRGVVPRSAVSAEGCVSERAASEAAQGVTPRFPGPLTCLFGTTSADESSPGVELWPNTPFEELERRPRWRRVRVQHGAAQLSGWLPALEDLAPNERPPVLPESRGDFPCRRTTRALELRDEVSVEVPAGTITTRSSYWTNVYVRRAEGSYLHMRVQTLPEDALAEPERCSIGAWEPWTGYMGRCFYPGIELEETAASPQFWPLSGRRLGFDALIAALRSVQPALEACGATGALGVVVTFGPEGRVEVSTEHEGAPVEGTTLSGEGARCPLAALRGMTLPHGLEEEARVRILLPLPTTF